MVKDTKMRKRFKEMSNEQMKKKCEATRKQSEKCHFRWDEQKCRKVALTLLHCADEINLRSAIEEAREEFYE